MSRENTGAGVPGGVASSSRTVAYTPVLQLCYSGVTVFSVVLQLCYSGVTGAGVPRGVASS
jgi:hypothetical protein